MDEIHIDTLPEDFTLEISGHGDVFITAWDKAELQARADAEDVLTFNKEENRAVLDSKSDLRVSMPATTALTLKSILGEAIIKGVCADIRADQATGGLIADGVGNLSAGQVGGHLNVKRSSGSVEAEQVAAIANLKSVAGPISLGMVAGHLNLVDPGSSVEATVSGNANLSLKLGAEQAIDIRSQGSITCRLDPESNVAVSLKGPGPVAIKLASVEDASSTEFSVGSGEGTLKLKASGPITVIERQPSTRDDDAFDFTVDFGAGFGNLGETLSSSIHEQLAAQMSVLEDGLEAQIDHFDAIVNNWPLSREDSERVSARVQEKISRAQEKVKRAKERAAKRVERAERKKAHRKRQARIKGDIVFGGSLLEF